MEKREERVRRKMGRVEEKGTRNTEGKRRWLAPLFLGPLQVRAAVTFCLRPWGAR